jgi:hypothetical protein
MLKMEEAGIPATSELTTLQGVMFTETSVAVRSENITNYFVV